VPRTPGRYPGRLVAEETASEQGGIDGSHEPRECMPCGGSGHVISNLGGSPQKVRCPWCAGSGERNTRADAQAAWRNEAEGVPADAERAEKG
jgi:hypothetical protein